MKVLMVSHEWEAAKPGGAQRSAAALTRALRDREDVEVVLASAVREPHDGPPGQGELLVVSETDTESYSWADPSYAANWASVLADVEPDVVHTHHYYHVGIELPLLVRRLLPRAGIVMTLHEYLAICLLSGQMVDSKGHLCLGASVTKCADCLTWPAERTFAREDYIRRGLADVDLFVTPSEFARSRYLSWGLPAERLRVIPNAVDMPQAADRVAGDGDILRLAFIGQHTPFKGLEVLLDAVARVRQDHPTVALDVAIYGGGSEAFGTDFANRLVTAHERVRDVVRFLGPYDQPDLAGILDAVDAIVVPSTWWENSPVVIEEALARRVPVICSDIGGMAEKVRDGVDGWHFSAGSPASLAELLVRLSRMSSLKLPEMRVPVSLENVAHEHLSVYGEARQRANERGTFANE